MAYGRRRKNNRRSRKRGKKGNPLATKQYVKRLVYGDTHQKNTSRTVTSVDLTGNLSDCISDVARGDTQSQRNGRDMTLSSIQFNWTAYRNSSSTLHDRMRLMIVMVKQIPAATTFMINKVIATTDTTGVGTGNVANDVTAFRRLLEGDKGNYRVLRDWTIDLGFGTTDKATRMGRYFKRFKKPIKATFSGSADTDYVQNSIWVLAMSDVTSGANPPILAYQARVNFLP